MSVLINDPKSSGGKEVIIPISSVLKLTNTKEKTGFYIHFEKPEDLPFS